VENKEVSSRKVRTTGKGGFQSEGILRDLRVKTAVAGKQEEGQSSSLGLGAAPKQVRVGAEYWSRLGEEAGEEGGIRWAKREKIGYLSYHIALLSGR